MKKTYLAALLAAAALALPAPALDYGGTADNTFTFATHDSAVTDVQNVTGWIKQPLNASGTSYIAAEALATFKVTGSDYSDPAAYLWLDVSLLKYAGLFTTASGSQVQVSLGRFGMTDATGRILDQTSDGAYLSINAQRFVLSGYAAYTGALNVQTTTILNEPASAYAYKRKAPYDFASPYAVGLLNASFPYFFLNQTFTVELLGAYGVDGPNGDNSGYNRAYATVGLNGPILRNLVYSATTTFANYTDAEALSNLTQASVTYYPDWLSSSVTASFLYASGSTGGQAEFRGFTSMTSTLAYDEPEYANLIMAGLACTAKPLPVLLVNAGVDLVWQPEGGYDGWQFSTGAQYQLFTDLLLSASLGAYFGSDSDDSNTSMSVHAVISF